MIKRLHSNLFYASDLEKTHEFYKKLGFNAQKSDDGVRVKLGDFTLAFIDENKTTIQNESGKTPKGLGVYTYVEVDDVDNYFEFVKKNGVVPRSEPKTWPWGKREFVIKDPDGYKFVFYAPAKQI
ncbi:MAG: VOC family protein [Candidatus Liptonbacteria bacterium]|nr:VOC family protein [Candidatus Liptonbacteria bacterium]